MKLSSSVFSHIKQNSTRFNRWQAGNAKWDDPLLLLLSGPSDPMPALFLKLPRDKEHPFSGGGGFVLCLENVFYILSHFFCILRSD